MTAQRREQALSDVSLSVTAIGGDDLVTTNTYNIEALQNLVPSMSFGNDFNFAKLFIRGIGLSSSLPGVDPSVALHVDGVVVSLAQAQLGSMFDLERVEVLRGPQGTLYGRNATGGAVNLITARPTDELDGYARLTVGGPDLNLVGEAAVGGPFSENIRARIAVRAIRRDGYGINELTGNDIDNARQFSTRAHLEFLPTDNLSILLTGEYHMEDDRSLAIKFREVSFPGVLTDAIPTNDGLSALGRSAKARAFSDQSAQPADQLRSDQRPRAVGAHRHHHARRQRRDHPEVAHQLPRFRGDLLPRLRHVVLSRLPARADRTARAAAPITGSRCSSTSSARNCRPTSRPAISTRSSGCSISTRRSRWKITSASTC